MSQIPEQSKEHADRTQSEAEKLHYDVRSCQAFLLFFSIIRSSKGFSVDTKGSTFQVLAVLWWLQRGARWALSVLRSHLASKSFVSSGFSSCKGLDALPHGAT
jgi:hypothetical protein